MSRSMDQYLHDANGRRLTQRERLARLNKQFADQSVSTDVPPGTLAERQQQRKTQAELGREIAERVAAKAAENQPPVNPYAARVAELESQLKWATPQERAGIERRLSMFREQAEQWAAQRAAEERQAEFNADPAVTNLVDHAAALERSHSVSHPDVSSDDVAYALALANSDAFATPAEKTAAYWQAIRAMDEKQAAAEAVKMQQATDKAAQVSAEYQAQKQRLDESAARLAHSQKMEGGADESAPA